MASVSETNDLVTQEMGRVEVSSSTFAFAAPQFLH